MIALLRCVVKFEDDKAAHEILVDRQFLQKHLDTYGELFGIDRLGIALIALKKEAVEKEERNIFLGGPEGYEYLRGPVFAVGIVPDKEKQPRITSLTDDELKTAKRLLSYLRDTSREGNKE